MLKIVRIIEKSTGNLIVKYPIFISLHSDINFDVDFYDEAWLNAIYDGLVERTNRSDYKILFV